MCVWETYYAGTHYTDGWFGWSVEVDWCAHSHHSAVRVQRVKERETGGNRGVVHARDTKWAPKNQRAGAVQANDGPAAEPTSTHIEKQ